MADTSTTSRSKEPASSAGSSRSAAHGRRVEFLAKVRYKNALPPPPFAPKLVEYELDTAQLLNAGSLSSVFLQRGLSPELDVELGIPIDLSVVDGAFDPATSEEAMCPPLRDDADMDPEDLALLAEPEVSGVAAAGMGSFASMASSSASSLGRASSGDLREEGAPSSSEIGIGTSFLRRTAYMSGDTRRTAKRKTAGLAAAQARSKESNIEAEVRRIEQTFVDAKQPLSDLKHPSKKRVHAVSSTPLLPDLKESDLTFSEVRLVGSASLRSAANRPTPEQLAAAIFHRTKVESAVTGTPQEWMSLFVPSSEDAAKLSAYRHELRDTLPAEEAQAEEETSFAMQKVQDNDVRVLRPRQKFEEVVITRSAEDGSYFYLPVSARYNLTRRRVDHDVQREMAEHEVDVLDLGVRELTPQESIQRDEIRSIYDPVNYG